MAPIVFPSANGVAAAGVVPGAGSGAGVSGAFSTLMGQVARDQRKTTPAGSAAGATSAAVASAGVDPADRGIVPGPAGTGSTPPAVMARTAVQPPINGQTAEGASETVPVLAEGQLAGEAGEAIAGQGDTVPVPPSLAAAIKAGLRGEAGAATKGQGPEEEGAMGPSGADGTVVPPPAVIPAPAVPTVPLTLDIAAGSQPATSKPGDADAAGQAASPAAMAAMQTARRMTGAITSQLPSGLAAAAADENEFGPGAGDDALSVLTVPKSARFAGRIDTAGDRILTVAASESKPAVQPLGLPAEFAALMGQRQAGDGAILLETGELKASPEIAGRASAGMHGSDDPGVPLRVLPIEIGMKALAGMRQFDIRLDPGELGRVDVNLSISDEGEVKARLVVDRVETLHLLQRDMRSLERTFEQAGLKPSESGVDISLRDQSDQSGQRRPAQDEPRPSLAANGDMNDDVVTTSPSRPEPVRRVLRLGGIDVSV